MKLNYVRLRDKGMQCASGVLPKTGMTSPTYRLTLIANIRSIKVERDEWPAPIFIPLERISNFQPDPAELAPKK